MARLLDAYRDPTEPGINPDGLAPEDVDAVAGIISRDPVPCAQELFPSRPVGYTIATKTIGRYAAVKYRAMRNRLAGNITMALALEERCERIYAQLPEFARW